MNKNVVMVDISEIIISNAFRDSSPRQEKINRRKEYYRQNGTIDTPIKITDKGLLVDGYTRYIAAKECGADLVPCVVLKPFRFIHAVHNHGGKIYTWKFIGIDISVGDVVLVQCLVHNKIRYKPVTVTEVYDSQEENIFKVRNVVKVLQEGMNI